MENIIGVCDFAQRYLIDEQHGRKTEESFAGLIYEPIDKNADMGNQINDRINAFIPVICNYFSNLILASVFF